MKLIIVYPPEYRTPIVIETVEDEEDANDRAAEVSQGFGQTLILTEKELKELINLII